MASPTSTSTEETFSETAAFAELVAWSKDRPNWQQDALRRLVAGDVLKEDDIEELTQICIDPKASFQPITDMHISSEAATGGPIALLRIENPTGVNAIAIEQKLEFSKNGLTVIYGDNGSGKSGYVRILKHACRTRDRGNKILRDVNDANATPQTAKVTFARGISEVTFDWKPELDGHPELPAVSIFDSKSANIHVEKTNAVAYIPQPMQVLESLASTCDRLKSRLEAQVTALDEQTPIALKSPSLGVDTTAGIFVRQLSSKSSTTQLEQLATLSTAEQQRLVTLEADLAQDPKRAAARIGNLRTRLEAQMMPLRRLLETSSDAAFLARNKTVSELSVKAEAAKIASDTLFAASPLPDIGNSVWRNLWEAARKYSNEVAYPEKIFPDAIVDKDLCVLCQQPLGNEAVQRRTTFEGFLKGTTKLDEENATKKYRTVMDIAVAARVTMHDLHQLCTLVTTEIGDLSFAKNIKDCGIRASWRLRAFVRTRDAPGMEPVFPEANLSELLLNLDKRVTQLTANLDSPEYLAFIKEFRELKDRSALTPLMADIKLEIERRGRIEAIRKALKETTKNAVTLKNKDLSEKLVTKALRERFAREIQKLKLSGMPVELKKMKDQNAVSYFQVCLVDRPNDLVGEIFSEGEHRCVALAAFLAELVTSKQYSGIVFDDPMSSLDHIHRKSVASRLVEEAEHRQVVIFTHDLTFLFELRREAEAKARPIYYQTISRKQTRPGYVEGELPNKAKSASQLATSLRSELKELKGQFDHLSDAKRTLLCKGIFEQLREAWDQGIADFIFPVLGRFDNHIKGTSLYKLAILNENDVKVVTAARGRLSEELHASSESLNPETIALVDLVAELSKLDAWLSDIGQRQKSAKSSVTAHH